jgi:hypothetical protein
MGYMRPVVGDAKKVRRMAEGGADVGEKAGSGWCLGVVEILF